MLSSLWIFLAIVVAGSVVVFIMTPNEATMNWLLGKFEMHPKIQVDSTHVTFDGESLEGNRKNDIITAFNDATFMQRYPQSYSTYSGTPVVLDTKLGRNHIRFYVYTYDNRVDVFKQFKQKVIAYCLSSSALQQCVSGLSQGRIRPRKHFT